MGKSRKANREDNEITLQYKTRQETLLQEELNEGKLRPRPEINYRLWAGVARRDDVIPIAMEPGRRNVDRLVLRSGDLDTLLIFSLIERCMNIQPRFGLRGTNECDHDFVAL